MHAGQRYSLREFVYWTRRELYWLTGIATVPTLLFQLLHWEWLAMPWVPIALVGTASAFLVGFRNTQTYNRAWEARQIWGGIVNSSRSWGIMSNHFVTSPNEEEAKALHKKLIYRHIAWLTALRFQLRESRAWENIKDDPANKEYAKRYTVDEWSKELEKELKPYLTDEDEQYVLSKKNRATHIINLQSKELKKLKEQGRIEPLNYVELEKLLVDLFDQQGRCERIKNFPYPRQFATINQMFVRLFITLIPYGMLNEFHRLGDWEPWLTIPFSVIISWVFLVMERVGEVTENPFEGGPNDVPITAMSRTIEIDLREMLDEKDLPPALQPSNKILM